MIIGTILYVFSIMMTSISTQYYQYLLAHGVLFGLGVGMLYVFIFHASVQRLMCNQLLSVSFQRVYLFLQIPGNGTGCRGVWI
jgi:hypothetical protein